VLDAAKENMKKYKINWNGMEVTVYRVAGTDEIYAQQVPPGKGTEFETEEDAEKCKRKIIGTLWGPGGRGGKGEP
jgi:hypothetical protein